MKILILGGNGMIGHKIYQVLKSYFIETWVSLRYNKSCYEKFDFFDLNKILYNIDLVNLENLSNHLNILNPDIIINAAGITIRRGVNNELSKTIRLNSVLPHFLEEWGTASIGTRIIHLSTDCVFSGESGNYSESSFTDAKDMYGRTKALGELNGSSSLTLRSSMIGREIDNNTELLEWFLKNNNKEIKGYSNALYSGITTLQMALFIKDIILSFPTLTGIINIASNPISKYDLLILLNKHFNNQSKILKDETYVSKKNLNAQKFYSITNFNIPDWENMIKDLKQDSDNNYKYYNN
jgi:dTDP-4-dehydrorhamnose reductase